MAFKSASASVIGRTDGARNIVDIVVQDGVVVSDTLIFALSHSLEPYAPVVVTTDRETAVIETLVAPYQDNNMFWGIDTITGLQTGDTVTAVGTTSSHGQLFAFAGAIGSVGAVGSRGGVTQSTITLPPVTTQPGNLVTALFVERSAANATTGITNTEGAPVTRLSYANNGVTDPSTSYCAAQYTVSGATSGSTTATYNGASGNGAGLQFVEDESVLADELFIAATRGTVIDGRLSFNGVVPAGVTKNHVGVMVFTAYAQEAQTVTGLHWTEVIPFSPFQTAGMIVMQSRGHLKAGDSFAFMTSKANEGSWVAAWYDSAGVDVVGVAFDRNGASSANTNFPSLTTTSPDQAVLVVAGEKSSRPPVTSISSMSAGVTIDAFLDGNFDSGTTSSLIGHFVQSSVGATAEKSATYSNGSTRGYAMQISLLPAATLPETTDGFTLWNGAKEVPTLVTLWDGTKEVAVSQLESATGSYDLNILTNATPEKPLYIAHRGGSANWPEMTRFAYSNAVKAYGMPAIEISVLRSSDGVFVCSHDANTARVTGQSYDIATTPWSTLLGLKVTAAATDNPAQAVRPLARLIDVLDDYAADHVIFIEDKSYMNGGPLLDLMDSYPDSTNHFVWKLFGGTGASSINTGVGRGYKTWGYFFTGANMLDFDTNGPRFDYVGIDMNCSDAEMDQAVALGKPMIGHTLADTVKRDRLLSYGCIGIVTADIKKVVPR